MEGALREFSEEVGEVLGDRDHRVADVHEDDHGGWSYWTVVVEVAQRFAPPEGLNWETAEAQWIPGDRLGALELHSAFRRTLGRLGVLHDSRP